MSMERKSRLAALALALGSWTAPARPGEPRFALELSTWLSEGRTRESHDASSLSPLLGDPTSVLTYEGLDSTVLEVAGVFRVIPRLAVGARIGRGGIDGGLLVDDDYLSAFGAEELGAIESGPHRWSRTHSSVAKDDLAYLDLELAWSALRIDPRRSLELLGAYGRLEETYVGTGVEQIECTLPPPQPPDAPLACAPSGAAGFENEEVISNAVEWNAWWVGLRTWRRLGQRFHLAGSFGWAFYTDVTADDVHHLRDDLAKDPSFRIEGEGQGLRFELGCDVQLTRRIALGAAWRRVDLEADTGTLTAFPAEGSPAAAPLEQIDTVRDGLTLGLTFGFGAGARRASPPPGPS
jgi:hypothetical protein